MEEEKKNQLILWNNQSYFIAEFACIIAIQIEVICDESKLVYSLYLLSQI